MSGRMHDVNCCKYCWHRRLMVETGGVPVGPDKTGHFRTLSLSGAWEGVSGARVTESTAAAKTEGRDAAASLVWDARVTESIMRFSPWVRGWDTGRFLATREGSTSETCSTVRGRDAGPSPAGDPRWMALCVGQDAGASPAGDPRWMAWAGQREAGEDASLYVLGDPRWMALCVGGWPIRPPFPRWPACVGWGGTMRAVGSRFYFFVRLVQQSSPFLF